MSSIDYSSYPNPPARYSKVYLSDSLCVADEWVHVPGFYAETITDAVSPGMSEARIVNYCGDFAHYWGEENVKRIPYRLDRVYVKIEILQPADTVNTAEVLPPMESLEPTVIFTWFGAIEYDELINPAGNPPRVDQVFVAYGLMRELELSIIADAVIAGVDTASVTEADRTYRIPQGLTFNPAATIDNPGLGNMYPTAIDNGDVTSWVFQREAWNIKEDPDESEKPSKWDAYTALDHLLSYHQPLNTDGDPVCQWGIYGTDSPSDPYHPANLVQWYEISNVTTDRRSVREVIDDLIDRRRFVGWYVEGDDTGEAFVARVRLFSFAAEDIEIDARVSEIVANPDQALLSLLDKAEVTSLQVSNNGVQQYDEVTAEGELITSTISIYVAPPGEEYEILAPGWTEDDQDAYLDAASGADGYDELSEEEQHAANAAVRSSDELRDVFSRFVLHSEWHAAPILFGEYKVTVDDDGIEALTALNVAEIFDAESEYEQSQLWTQGARFLRYLPTENGEPREPFLLWVVNREVNPPTVMLGEQLNATGERAFAVGLEPLADALGVRLRVGQSGAQHMIAADDWVDAAAVPDGLDPTDEENGALHYQGGTGEIAFRCIVALPWNRRVWASESISGSNLKSVKRIKRIYVPDSRLDIRLPWTSRGINSSGQSDVDEDGTILRDDRDKLRSVASAAAQWYGMRRQAMLLSYDKITLNIRHSGTGETNETPIALGTLVTRVGIHVSNADVNSPITSISFDLSQQRTTIQTTFYDGEFV